MQSLVFNSVPSSSDHTVRVRVWRGPQGDFAVGQTDAERPAGYRAVDLTGAVLLLTVYKGAVSVAQLRSDGTSPQLIVLPGVGGRIEVTFRATNFTGSATGTYDHAMKCTFPGGKAATLWVGPLHLISVPA